MYLHGRGHSVDRFHPPICPMPATNLSPAQLRACKHYTAATIVRDETAPESSIHSTLALLRAKEAQEQLEKAIGDDQDLMDETQAIIAATLFAYAAGKHQEAMELVLPQLPAPGDDRYIEAQNEIAALKEKDQDTATAAPTFRAPRSNYN